MISNGNTVPVLIDWLDLSVNMYGTKRNEEPIRFILNLLIVLLSEVTYDYFYIESCF